MPGVLTLLGVGGPPQLAVSSAGSGGGASILLLTPTTSTGNGTSATLMHSGGSATGAVAIISFFAEDQDVSSMTYGGTAMSLETTSITGAFENRCSIYSLLAPPTGTRTVSAAFTGGANDWAMTVYTVENGNTSAVLGGVANTSGTTNSPDPSLTISTASGDIVIAGITGIGGGTITAAQTEDQNVLIGGGTYGSEHTSASATSIAMSWAKSANNNWVICGGSFKQ